MSAVEWRAKLREAMNKILVGVMLPAHLGNAVKDAGGQWKICSYSSCPLYRSRL